MHTCKECGKEEKNKWTKDKADRLEASKLCFTCDFWMENFDRVGSTRTVIVKGVHYSIGDEGRGDKSSFRGYGGSKFVVHFNDGRIVESTNLWCQGEIPERFKDRLPDNATFLNPAENYKATEKSPQVTNFLEELSEIKRDEAVCATCKAAIGSREFRDYESLKEFRISRMCQSCQDSVFGAPEDPMIRDLRPDLSRFS